MTTPTALLRQAADALERCTKYADEDFAALSAIRQYLAAPKGDEMEAFNRYIAECDGFSIVPDVGGAFHWAWQASPSISAAEPGSIRERNLAMMIRKLCSRRPDGSFTINEQRRDAALELLRSMGLQGSPLRTSEHLADASKMIADPACPTCHGEGRYVAGYSGREDDGNAPLIEDCDCFIPHPTSASAGTAPLPALLQFVSDEEWVEILQELDDARHPHEQSPDLDAMQCAVLANLIDWFRQRSARASLAGASPVPKLTPMQATAPRRINLCVSDDREDEAEPFPDDHDGITWAEDEPVSACVPYVRADLSRLAVAGHDGLTAAMVKLSRALGHPKTVEAREGQSVEAALVEAAADRIQAQGVPQATLTDAKDAARYRWLHHLGPHDEPIWTPEDHFDYAANMDAAIDAAMAAPEKDADGVPSSSNDQPKEPK